MTQEFRDRKHPEKTSSFAPYGTPAINTNQLINTMWTSPRVAMDLSEKEKNLATGALHASSLIAGSPYVTPGDMARLTAGMGVGYMSGRTAGNILGALVGLPPSAQNTLANTGMYAGAIKAAIPMMYGLR